MHRHMILVLSSLALLVATGCATIVHGTNQQVSISSTPSGASVRVNGQYYGVTPLVLNLRRKEIHIVQMTKEGYQDYEITLERAISAWTVGNAAFGDGLIFAALDGMDGAFYRLHPDELVATLSPSRETPPVKAPVAPQAAMDTGSVAQQLIDLKELLDAGVLSPAEYEARRAHLLPQL